MFQLVNEVREKNPLIHNMTNVVVTNFTANGLLAIGASPVMAYAKEEAADMARISGALVLNIGTLSETEVESMILAGKAANEQRIPVVFDPVGAGATPFRTEMSRKILNEVKISIIRGNAAEVAAITGEKWEIKGVDAGSGDGSIVELANKAAHLFGCTVVITGKEDVITDGGRTHIVENGHELLTKVTGTGCLLSSVIAAYTALEQDSVKAAATAVSAYGIAAEKAAATTAYKGPGSFQIEFLDQLSKISKEDEVYAKIKTTKE